MAGRFNSLSRLEHDPEKWIPVFGKDHAHTKKKPFRRRPRGRSRLEQGEIAFVAGAVAAIRSKSMRTRLMTKY